jgi:hypothetical protein
VAVPPVVSARANHFGSSYGSLNCGMPHAPIDEDAGPGNVPIQVNS